MAYKMTDQKVVRVLRLLQECRGSKRHEELVGMYNKKFPPWWRLAVPVLAGISGQEMKRILSFLVTGEYVEVVKRYSLELDEDPPRLRSYYSLSRKGNLYTGAKH